MYCAATAADCPFVAKKAQLMKMAKNRQCGPDETSCPAGCCPEANVLLPRQHVLCCHRCRLSLRCQEGPAHEDGPVINNDSPNIITRQVKSRIWFMELRILTIVFSAFDSTVIEAIIAILSLNKMLSNGSCQM